jgi:hypothetical protein
VKKTGRVVVVHEAPKSCGFGAELVSLVCEHAFVHLEAPPVRVTGYDTPFPYTLEMDYLPLAGASCRPSSRRRRFLREGTMSTAIEFKLPDLGEGVTEGEIVAWHVAVGDGSPKTPPWWR